MADKTYDTPEEKPTGNVGSLSVEKTNGTRSFLAKWKVVSALTSTKNADGKKRTESLSRQWMIGTLSIGKSGTKKGSVKGPRERLNITTTETGTNLYNFVSESSRTYHRESDFFPARGKPMASGITVSVWCVNRKGSADSPATATYKFEKPGKPAVGALKQAEATGDVSCTITAYDDTKSRRERYDTRWQMRVFDSRKKKSSTNPKVTEGTFTGSKKTIKTDVAQRMQLGYGNYVRVDVRAMSRGLAGMSDGLAVGKSSESKAWTAWKSLYVSYPKAPSVKSVSIPSAGPTGKVTVNVDTNSTTSHPVTGIRLEVLRNSTASTASGAAADGGWESTDIVDDGNCKALATSVQDVSSTRGLHSWVRVKSWNQFETLFYRYSAPVELSKLFMADETAADDECAILSATPTKDGTSAKVIIGYDKKGGGSRDDADGTEVSWSSDQHAWKSTEPPSTFEVTWRNATANDEAGDDGYPYRDEWYYTQTVFVRGLEPGETYYVRARRYNDGESSGRTYGTYAKAVTVNSPVPVALPSSVTLSAPSFVERDTGVPLTWTFEGDATQTGWKVLTGTVTKTTETRVVDGQTVDIDIYRIKGQGTVVAQGTDPMGAANVPASWMAGSTCAKYTRADGTVPLAVAVSTGGGWATSDAVLVGQADKPKLEISVPATVASQPMEMSLSCSTDASVAIVVRAGGAGCTASGVGDDRDQAMGDVVWQTATDPEWADATATSANLATNDPDWWGYEDGGMALRVLPERMAPCDEGLAYTCSVSGETTGEDGTWLPGMAFLSEDMSELSAHVGTGTSVTATAPEGAAYVAARLSRELDGELAYADATEIGDRLLVMLEQGGSASPWVAPAADALGRHATVPTPVDPLPLDLRDGGTYVVTARATDLLTGLSGDEVTASFRVEWEHQAPVPPDSVTVTPSDTTDEDGVRTRQCVIALAPPAGAQPGDTYDVYRLTPDGPYRIATGVATDAVVTDPYAPFGGTETYYRVVCRTANGDMERRDYPYELGGSDLRIDFDGEYVELPYNLVPSDSYGKDFEARAKMSGDVDGYWNEAVQRTAGFSTDLIRVSEQAKAAALRRLARHAGACFVRAPDGCAYPADVQVTSMQSRYGAAALAVTLDVTEVSMTDEFRAVVS